MANKAKGFIEIFIGLCMKLIDCVVYVIEYFIDKYKESEKKAKIIEKTNFYMSLYEAYSVALYNFIENCGVNIGIIPVKNPIDLLCYDIYHNMIPGKFVFSVPIKDNFDVEQARKIIYANFYKRYPEMRRMKRRIILSKEGSMLYIKFCNPIKIMGDYVVFDFFDGKLKVFSKIDGSFKLEIKAKEKFRMLHRGVFIETSFDIEFNGVNYIFVWYGKRFSFIPGIYNTVTVMDNTYII